MYACMPEELFIILISLVGFKQNCILPWIFVYMYKLGLYDKPSSYVDLVAACLAFSPMRSQTWGWVCLLLKLLFNLWKDWVCLLLKTTFQPLDNYMGGIRHLI